MPADAIPKIDPDRLQHDTEYRLAVIRKIADRFIQKAEEQDFDTTYEQLADRHLSLTSEVSDHVEAKVESLVEQAITKARLRRGEIRKTARSHGKTRPASSGESSGADVGQIVALPKN